jgi:Transposase IS4
MIIIIIIIIYYLLLIIIILYHIILAHVYSLKRKSKMFCCRGLPYVFNHGYIHRYIYARQQGQVDKYWYDTDADEIRALFGIFIIMSINKLPCYFDYWDQHPYLHSYIHHIMPRDRYTKLLQYIHVNNNNNNNANQHISLSKLQPIITTLSHTFTSSFTCGTHQCIDELMISFRGRTHFIQYMPKKRIRYGIKVWCRADSESGFITQFNIYMGKQQQPTQQIIKHTHHIINILTYQLRLQPQSFMLYFDNYFTSTDILRELATQGVYATGTVRINRAKFPQVYMYIYTYNIYTCTYIYKYILRDCMAYIKYIHICVCSYLIYIIIIY